MGNKLVSLAILAGVFAMMCVMRWWFTLYVIFAAAILLTASLKRRKYCHNLCPMATIQQITYSKGNETRSIPPKTLRLLRRTVQTLFWVLLFGVSLYYGAAGRLVLLWHRLLLLMMLSMASAVLLQELYGKRFWCAALCPLGGVLDRVIRARRIGGGK